MQRILLYNFQNKLINYNFTKLFCLKHIKVIKLFKREELKL